MQCECRHCMTWVHPNNPPAAVPLCPIPCNSVCPGHNCKLHCPGVTKIRSHPSPYKATHIYLKCLFLIAHLMSTPNSSFLLCATAQPTMLAAHARPAPAWSRQEILDLLGLWGEKLCKHSYGAAVEPWTSAKIFALGMQGKGYNRDQQQCQSEGIAPDIPQRQGDQLSISCCAANLPLLQLAACHTC